MIDIDKIDDFPKLVPDESICFDAKDEIRRSPEMDYECSELEYKHIVEEEKFVEKYRIRLVPDTGIVMPDKNALKHKTFNHRLLWLSFAATAAALALILIIVNNKSNDKADNSTAIVIPPASQPETEQPETETVAETKPNPNLTTETKPKPVIRPDKTVKNRINATATNKAVTTTKKPASTVVEAVEQDTVTETSANKDNIPSPESPRIEKLERIASIVVPVEAMNKEKTVFIYQFDEQQTIAPKSIEKVASMVQKLSIDIADTKDNVTKIFDSFKIPDILSRLSLDRGIDKEIDEWAKNNPDIPFNVLIDETSKNKMKEIYDEKGTLVRVIFITNKSLKYKGSKTYHAKNNN
jgi:hypothetical protein